MKALQKSIGFVLVLGIGLLGCSKNEMKEQQVEVRSQLEQTLSDIDSQIDKMKRQSETATDSVKVKMERRVDQLDSTRQDLKDQLDKVAETTAVNWDEFRRGVDRSAENARETIRDIQDDLSR
jgi:hypothetical protein